MSKDNDYANFDRPNGDFLETNEAQLSDRNEDTERHTTFSNEI